MLRNDINFNIRFDADSRAKLQEITNFWHCSNADTVRRLVRASHAHIFTATPKCADGARCFVPQMHAKRTAEE